MESKPKLLTSEERAAIRKRREKATPGPWSGGQHEAPIALTFDREANIYPPDTTETHGFQFGGPVAVVSWRGESDSNPDGADADFIEHAPTDISALLDDIEAREQGDRRERQMWINACNEVFIRPESIALIGNFDNPVRQALQPFVDEIAALRKALETVREQLDGIGVASRRLRNGYSHIHVGIPIYCESFDRSSRDALALIDAALTPQPRR